MQDYRIDKYGVAHNIGTQGGSAQAWKTFFVDNVFCEFEDCIGKGIPVRCEEPEERIVEVSYGKISTIRELAIEIYRASAMLRRLTDDLARL